MTTRMLVATHKAAMVPSGEFYLPIHVGHALNPIDLGFQPDDIGENISKFNQAFCELTAVYWAWKNLQSEGLGLSHYRRYFTGEQDGPAGKGVLSERESGELLDQYDVILPTPRNYVLETIDSHYRNGHHGEDLEVVRRRIASVTPQYLEAYDRVFAGRKLSLYNMFLMRREAFDAYASWLFPLLAAVDEQIESDGRSAYQKRTMGYLGERLLNVWVSAHATELRVGFRKVVNTEGEPKFRKGIGLVQRKLAGRLAR